MKQTNKQRRRRQKVSSNLQSKNTRATNTWTSAV